MGGGRLEALLLERDQELTEVQPTPALTCKCNLCKASLCGNHVAPPCLVTLNQPGLPSGGEWLTGHIILEWAVLNEVAHTGMALAGWESEIECVHVEIVEGLPHSGWRGIRRRTLPRVWVAIYQKIRRAGVGMDVFVGMR